MPMITRLPLAAVSVVTVALVLATTIRPVLAGSPDEPRETDSTADMAPPEKSPASLDGTSLPAEEETRRSINADPLDGANGLDPSGLVDAEERAYALYLEGLRAWDAEDPEHAISAWEQAVVILPDEQPYAYSRLALALRVVLAHELHFRHRGQLDDLRRQVSLLRGYQQHLPEVREFDEFAREQRRAHAQVRIDQLEVELDRFEQQPGLLEEQLAKSLRGEYDAWQEITWKPESEDLVWHRRSDTPQPRTTQAEEVEAAPPKAEPEHETDLEPPGHRGTGLLASGAVSGLLGVGGLGVGIAGLLRASEANEFDPLQAPSERRAQITRGHQGNAIAIAGALGGGALALAGTVMLAVGSKRRKESATNLTLSPSMGPNAWGLRISTHF